MTKAEREQAALKRVCPRCNAGAGTKCKNTSVTAGPAPRRIAHPHTERLALVPKGGQ